MSTEISDSEEVFFVILGIVIVVIAIMCSMGA